MNSTLDRTSYRACSLSDIPLGEGRQVRVGERDIAVFYSRNGCVYATDAACPHRAGPLADGILGGSTLICPLHALKFNLMTGEAVSGICSIQTYLADVDPDGIVIVWI